MDILEQNHQPQGREATMQVIVVKSPKCLAGVLRALFKIKKEN
ncbi:hypothetical protein [Allofournierella sp. CML151]|nr:hypothetical protein [Fournierella sp. CML151]